MDQIIRQIEIFARGLWRYRWLAVATAWAVAVVGVVVVFSIPKKYEATARIFVNTDSILKPLMVGVTVQPNNDQRIAMLSRVVISRPNVDKLIRASGLDDKVKTAEQREKLIDDVIKVLQLKDAESDNLYVVSFRDRKPERAQKVVEILVSMFIDSSKGGGDSDANAAEKFLDDQAKSYETKLKETEDQLKEFKLRNIDIDATEGKDYFARMAEAGVQLSQAQLQLREAENSRDALKRGLAGEDVVNSTELGGAGGDSISDIESRLDAQKRSLDSLLQKYTDSHPDVTGARRVIAELEAQKRQIIEDHRRTGIPLVRSGSTNGTRAYDQLRVSLTQAEASVASLRARVADFSARYARLREMAQKMPQAEAELAQLNRDYEMNKKNYESLVSKRESASISGQMQSVAGVADFRLVDPPRVSPRAVSPNRGLLLPFTLVLALGSAIGMVLLMLEIRPTFFDGKALRDTTGLPVLGIVSFDLSPALKLGERQELKRFIKWLAVLFAVYILIVLVSYWFSIPVPSAREPLP